MRIEYSLNTLLDLYRSERDFADILIISFGQHQQAIDYR